MRDEKGGTLGEEKETRRIHSVRDLEVYKLAFESAMEIFEISKRFPKYEHIFAMLVTMERKAEQIRSVKLSDFSSLVHRRKGGC